MKKIYILLFATLIATQVFATTDITGSSASCDSGVLGVEYGGVALKADYSPETIELRWYDDNGKQIAVTSEYDSCTYNEAITIPTAPEKTGYKFAGWKVRPKYDFSTLRTDVNGEYRYGIGESGGSDLCVYGDSIGGYVTCDSRFDDLNRHQWKTPFSWGTIYGDGLCSTTNGTYANSGTPENTAGIHCWCKTTAYKNGATWYSPISNSSWIYLQNMNSSSFCANDCAYDCAYHVQNSSDFREAMFGLSN